MSDAQLHLFVDTPHESLMQRFNCSRYTKHAIRLTGILEHRFVRAATMFKKQIADAEHYNEPFPINEGQYLRRYMSLLLVMFNFAYTRIGLAPDQVDIVEGLHARFRVKNEDGFKGEILVMPDPLRYSPNTALMYQIDVESINWKYLWKNISLDPRRHLHVSTIEPVICGAVEVIATK